MPRESLLTSYRIVKLLKVAILELLPKEGSALIYRGAFFPFCSPWPSLFQ